MTILMRTYTVRTSTTNGSSRKAPHTRVLNAVRVNDAHRPRIHPKVQAAHPTRPPHFSAFIDAAQSLSSGLSSHHTSDLWFYLFLI